MVKLLGEVINLKKKIKYGVFIVLALLLLIIKLQPNNVSAEEVKKVDITAEFGVAGVFREGQSVPVTVKLTNTSEEKLEGELELKTKQGNLYVKKVTLESKEEKKVVILAGNLETASKISITYKEGDTIYGEAELLVNGTTYNSNGAIIDVISKDKDKLKFLEEVSSVDSNYFLEAGKFISEDISFFENNYKNFSLINVIVINNYDSSNFTETMIANLKAWVNNGGILLVGGSTSTINNMNKNLLNVTYTEGVDKEVTLDEEKVTLKVGTLAGEYGTPIVLSDNTILATNISLGSGNIILTTFDLEGKNFIECEKRDWFITKLLANNLKITSDGGVDTANYYEINEDLEKIPTIEGIKPWSIFGILVIFALVASFVSYFILKKLRKRNLLWITIPIFSIIFTLIIVNISKETEISNKVITSLNVVAVNKDGKGNLESYIGVANKYKSTLEIVEPEDSTLQYLDLSSMYGMPSTNEDKIKLITRYDGDKVSYDFKEISPFEFKKFKKVGKTESFERISCNLNYLDDKLQGTVKNTLSDDIEELYVVYRNNIWKVGALKAGEEYSFQGNSPDIRKDINIYVMENSNSYWMDYGNLSKEELKSKYNGQGINIDLISLAASKVGKEPVCIAITNKEFNYGLEFEKGDVSKYSKTVFIDDIEIDLKDSDGNTNYPYGFIEPNIEKSDDGIYVDTSSSVIYGMGSVTFNYVLPEKFVPSAVSFKSIIEETDSDTNLDNMYKEYISDFAGKFEIYNFKRDKFEELTYNEGDILQVKNLDDYIKDGNIKTKITKKTDEGQYFPNMSTKGRFKE